MSNPSAPSIPVCPTPGKDPPPPASTSPSHEARTEPFSKLSALPKSPDAGTQPESPPISTKDVQDKASMPPPAPPIRPTITTQPPSRSTTFQPGISNLPSHAHSQNEFLEHGAGAGEEGEIERVKPRPPFNPLFTLINDVKGFEKEGEAEKTTYHPRNVHYLFSDDDASEVLSGALLRSLQTQSRSQSQAPHHAQEPTTEPESGTTSSDSLSTFRKEKQHSKRTPRETEKDGAGREREERIIIIDINDSGDGIKSISSLNKEWQVLGASIDNAPTWDGAEADGEGENANAKGGLMLRIEGVSMLLPSPLERSDQGIGLGNVKGKERDVAGGGERGLVESGNASGTIVEEEMQTLLEGFDRKMAVLRRVFGQHQGLSHHGHGSGSRVRDREGSGGSGRSGQGGESAVTG